MMRHIIKYRDFILLFLNVAIRMLFISVPFWGLEYEDSFIFNDTSRYLNFNGNFNSDFLTHACIDGSFQKCNSDASFGGHFWTFPFILSKFHLLIGYHYWNVFALNCIFSILLLGAVFVWHTKSKDQKPFSLSAFLVIMLITPFVTVFQTSGLSETFSSLMILLTVISVWEADKNNFRFTSYALWLTLVCLILAIITKRENLILLSLFALIPVFRFIKKRRIFCAGYLVLLCVSLLFVSFFFHYIDLFSIESNEGTDIGRNTFSISFLFQNLTQTFVAFSSLRYWGLTGIAFMLSIFLLIVKRTHNQLGLFCLILSVLYMLLYSSHYRSYYQVHYNLIHPFETLRYAVNYFPLVSIFISAIAVERISHFKQSYRKPILVAAIFAFLFLLFNSVRTRFDFSMDEYYSRIKPVEETLEIIKENDVVISDLPIVFHCFVSEKQRIVDYYSLSQERLSNLILTNEEADVYLIRRIDSFQDSVRYNSNFNIHQYCFKKINLPIENYELIKYCHNASTN